MVNGTMTLMLDPEPTLAAPSEDETQSLHAWSQEDSVTEVVDYRTRSWKIPALVVTLAAAAAVTAGLFAAWPESATKPQVAPTQVAIPSSPPVQVQSPDQRFIALLKQRGLKVYSESMAINAAHAACTAEAQGRPDSEIAAQFVASSPLMDLKKATIFVYTAHEVYCK